MAYSEATVPVFSSFCFFAAAAAEAASAVLDLEGLAARAAVLAAVLAESCLSSCFFAAAAAEADSEDSAVLVQSVRTYLSKNHINVKKNVQRAFFFLHVFIVYGEAASPHRHFYVRKA